MSITNLDGLINALANGQVITFFKNSDTSEGAGFYHSLWRVTGQPGTGSLPASSSVGGETHNTDTFGALKYSNLQNPSNSHYLARFAATSTVAGMVILYDRLWSCSGLNLGASTPHSITPAPTLPDRPDNTGNGVELWFEIFNTGSSFVGSVTYTATYINSDNTPGRIASFTIPGGGTTVPSIRQMYRMQLDTGDTGVRTVTGLTGSHNSTNATTTGGFVLMRRICEIPLSNNSTGLVLDAFQTGMPIIYSGSCLSLVVLCSATSTGNWLGQLNIVEG